MRIVEEGVVLIAAGPAKIFHEAFRAASSIRQVYGHKVHITLMTDVEGITHTLPFANQCTVDRVISATKQKWEKKVKAGIKSRMVARQFKQKALRRAARYYKRLIVTDADTFHCDDRAIPAIFNMLEGGADLVAPSRARRPSGSIQECSKQFFNILISPKTATQQEINTGVLGLQGLHNAAVDELLRQWPVFYDIVLSSNAALKSACGDWNDQPSFRLAVANAEEHFGLIVRRLFEEKSENDTVTTPSMMKFNCRARPKNDAGNEQLEAAHCADNRFSHCAIIHGHTLAEWNTRGLTQYGGNEHPDSGSVDGLPRLATPRHSSNVRSEIEGATGEVLVFVEIPGVIGKGLFKRFMDWLDPAAVELQLEEIVEAKRLRKKWVPPRAVVFGQQGGNYCRWLQGIKLTRDIPCKMVTIVRDPIDRMIAEYNACVDTVVGCRDASNSSLDRLGISRKPENGEPIFKFTCPGLPANDPPECSELQGEVSKEKWKKWCTRNTTIFGVLIPERCPVLCDSCPPSQVRWVTTYQNMTESEAAFLRFARSRGNVQVEHIAGILSIADFAVFDSIEANADASASIKNLSDALYSHVGKSELPIERRRQRIGPVNQADLLVAANLLTNSYFAVGVADRLEETLRNFAQVLAPSKTYGHCWGPLTPCGTRRTRTHPLPLSPTKIDRSKMSDLAIEMLHNITALDSVLFTLASGTFRARLHEKATSK
jgi:hypothetical protein